MAVVEAGIDGITLSVDDFEEVLKACISKLDSLKKERESCMYLGKKITIERNIVLFSAMVFIMEKWISCSEPSDDFVIIKQRRLR